MSKPTVYYTHPGGLHLTRAYRSLGYDIELEAGVVILAGQHTKIPTGYRLLMPDTVDGAIIKERSSIAARGITTLGGVIDSDYTGELFLVLANLTQMAISLPKSQRVANLIFLPSKVDLVSVTSDEFESLVTQSSNKSTRGDKGFGSTDKE